MAIAKKAATAPSTYKVIAGEVTQGRGDETVIVTAESEDPTVELTDAEATRLIALGMIQPVEIAPAPAPAPAPASNPAT